MAEHNGTNVGVATLTVLPVIDNLGKNLSKQLASSGRDVDKLGAGIGKRLAAGIGKGAKDGKGLAELEREIRAQANKTAKSVESAREKEADATRKAKIAQQQYEEAVAKGGKESTRALQAEDRLVRAKRAQTSASGSLTRALKTQEAEQKDANTALGRAKRGTKDAGNAWEKLGSRIKGSLRGADKSIDSFGDRSAKKARKAGESTGRGFSRGFLDIAKGVLAADVIRNAASGAVNLVKDSYGEAREAQKVGAQTAAAIKATGGAAKVSTKQVGAYATKLSNITGIDDETIQSGQNMLLTFKNIRNEQGKGNDIFNQSTKTLTDMSTAMGTEPKKAAIQLGKALNDPVKGITALSRVGVTFSAGQKKQITGLVKSGKTMKAQKIILKELNSEFGGSAKAQATAGEKLTTTWNNFKEDIGTKLLPVIDKVFGFLAKTALPVVENLIDKIGGSKGLKSAFSFVQDALKTFMPAAMSYFKTVFGAIKGFLPELMSAGKQILPVIMQIISAALRIGKSVAPVIVDLAKQIIPLLGAAFKAAGRIVSAVLPVIAGVVRDLVKIVKKHMPEIRAMVKAALPVFNQIADVLKTVVIPAFKFLWKIVKPIISILFGFVIRTIKNALKIVSGLLDILKGIFTGNFGLIKKGVGKIFGALWDQVKNILGSAVKILKSLFGPLVKWFADKAGAIKDKVVSAFTKAVDLVGKVWAGIQAAARKPVDFVINTVINGMLIKGINWIAKKLGLGDQWIKPITLGAAPKAATGGGGMGPKAFAGFADGGYTGPGSKFKPAGIVHAGEVVWDKDAVAKAGGPKQADALRLAAKSGRLDQALGGYSDGGIVSFKGGRFSEKFARVVMALAKRVPGFQMYQGGWNAGGVAASGGTHDKDALDFGPANRSNETTARSLGIAAWLRNAATGWTQTAAHIHAVPSPSLGSLSPSAAAQWQNYLDGSNGLVGNAPDTGDRRYVKGGSAIGGLLEWSKEKIAGKLGGFLKLGGLDKFGDIGTMLKRGVGKLTSAATAYLYKHQSAAEVQAGSGFQGTAASGHNQQLAKQLLATFGFSSQQWGPLQKLWMKESGFRTNANNPSSGAYGIPQALPGSKMAGAGADWRTNPATQIRWGLQYIKSRYGNPAAAWAHSQATNWYAKGTNHAKKGLAVVGEAGPELVNFNGGEKVTSNKDLMGAVKAFLKANTQQFKSNQVAKFSEQVERLKKSLAGLKKPSATFAAAQKKLQAARKVLSQPKKHSKSVLADAAKDAKAAKKQMAGFSKEARKYTRVQKKLGVAQLKLRTAQGISTTKGIDKVAANFVKKYRSQTQRLAKIADQRKALAGKLKQANARLSAAVSSRSEYKSGIRDTFAGVAELPTDQTSASTIVKSMLSKLTGAKSFLKNLKQLKKLGLNRSMLQQLIDAGPVDGGTAAAALVKGGLLKVRDVNSIQKQILSVGDQTAEWASAAMGFDSKVGVAKRQVASIKKQDAALAKSQTRIGKAVESDAKKRLRGHLVKESAAAKRAGKSKEDKPTYVYVQNPWSGEYLLTKVEAVADKRISTAAKKAKTARK